MPIIARAGNVLRIKNLALVAMCLVACVLFLYDGFHRYPYNNDLKIQSSLSRYDQAADDPNSKNAERAISPDHIELMRQWTRDGGWNSVPADMRERMDAALRAEAGQGHVSTEGWKGPFDVTLQRGLAWGLVACVAAAVWRFVHFQRKRAIADESTVSPAPGVIIPWEKITVIDNTRWKSHGTVDITYLDAQGEKRTAEFDEYHLQREPLLAILDQLSEKAVNAEFLPKPEPAAEAPAQAPADPQPLDTPQDPPAQA